MKIFIILASVIIMLVGFMTVGFINTVLIAASGAGAFWFLKNNFSKNGSNGNGYMNEAYGGY